MHKSFVLHTAGCSTLSNPENGRVIIDDTHIGGIAIYECNNGYTVTRVGIRICLQNGET